MSRALKKQHVDLRGTGDSANKEKTSVPDGTEVFV